MSHIITIPVRCIDKYCRACGENRTFKDACIHEGRFKHGTFRCSECNQHSRIWLGALRGCAIQHPFNLEPIWDEYHGQLIEIAKRAAFTPEGLMNAHCLEAVQAAAFRLGRHSWMDIQLRDVRRALESIESELARFGLRDLTMQSAFTIYSLLKDLQNARPLVIQVELSAAIISGNPLGLLAAIFSALAPDRIKRSMTVYLLGRVAWVLMLPADEAIPPQRVTTFRMTSASPWVRNRKD